MILPGISTHRNSRGPVASALVILVPISVPAILVLVPALEVLALVILVLIPVLAILVLVPVLVVVTATVTRALVSPYRYSLVKPYHPRLNLTV